MALNSNIQVEIPEHGIAYKKVSGKTYVYYVTASYRNEKGKPTCDRISIGKLDETTGKLIPNRNYYEVYLHTNQPVTKAVYDYGMFYVFSNVIKALGIDTILKRVFPDKYKEILTAAQYMLSEGNVMRYIENYTDTHTTYLNATISDSKCSDIFSSIRNEDILLFMREWMKKKKSSDYVAYDVTSISSYSKQIPELEWGYNRDKERLPQLNMGMYFGEESKLPLYYRIYPGSISDKAHLKYMAEDNEFIAAKRIRYVMDRGFYSADNLKYLADKGNRFIIALPGSLKYVRELISKHRNEIVNSSACMLGKGKPYGKKYETAELGFRMNVHLYYDPEKSLRDSEALYELIDNQENELRTMEEPPERDLHYDKYFFINRSKDGKLGFVRNYKAIDEALSRCGFFAIAETDFKKTTAEILDLYRRRDSIEKSFDDLKNALDFKRVKTHNIQTLQGKIFVSFISLIVKSYLQNSLQNLDITHKELILTLDKIKIFDLHSKNKPHIINPPTKFARDILQVLNIPSDFVWDNFAGV